MELARIFGRKVRAQRLAKGLTLEDLAHDSGLSYSYLGQLERGRRNPTLKIVSAIAVALTADASTLLAKD